ncbi:hypothetical protein HDF23_005121 [Mucilaginibacter lappiensis]|uniref:Uncharacterized protein n=1 Tax=Mucilaginibacter lappiensis TaxID=354630 RepID=A0ABR6PRE0_9SPHI|nr:hypothetical protein [Mucilaginibacter lappiensis]
MLAISIKKVCHFDRAWVGMSVVRKRNLLLNTNLQSQKISPRTSFEMTNFLLIMVQ